MYTVIFVTASSKEEAKKIAESLLADKLIACANIIEKVTSIYLWEGKIENSEEVLMVIKTKEELFDKVAAKVKSLHSYSVPEIISLPIEKGNKDYLSWIEECVKQ
ncbi:MAG: divalent-cation tolerance protein CutA [Candidatus Omnitrophica bacterium]|nr:divalent-cation tolerance protein CutA [Candidatus Omnitrophota bacterium]